MKPLAAAKTKYGIWGLIVGACVTMIIGFAWGGWTTGSSVKMLMKDAVLESQVAICVAQFKMAEHYQDALKEFQKTNSYSRAEFVEKGGWDKMPGQEEADWDVSQECASGLESLI